MTTETETILDNITYTARLEKYNYSTRGWTPVSHNVLAIPVGTYRLNLHYRNENDFSLKARMVFTRKYYREHNIQFGQVDPLSTSHTQEQTIPKNGTSSRVMYFKIVDTPARKSEIIKAEMTLIGPYKTAFHPGRFSQIVVPMKKRKKKRKR